MTVKNGNKTLETIIEEVVEKIGEEPLEYANDAYTQPYEFELEFKIKNIVTNLIDTKFKKLEQSLSQTPKIYAAIASVMKEIGEIGIGKNQKNTGQGFKFRGIDDAYNALNPLMAKYKVFTVPEVLNVEREERKNTKGTTLLYSIATIKYTFYAEDGSSVCAVVVGEGMDSGDKGMNKAMSIAHKYALWQVFCVPTEECDDPDKESHEVAPKTKASKVGLMTEDHADQLRQKRKDLKLDIHEQVIPLLETYGVNGFSTLPDSKFEEVMAKLDELGKKQNQDD